MMCDSCESNENYLDIKMTDETMCYFIQHGAKNDEDVVRLFCVRMNEDYDVLDFSRFSSDRPVFQRSDTQAAWIGRIPRKKVEVRKTATCECGAVKCKTTHAQWCPVFGQYHS